MIMNSNTSNITEEVDRFKNLLSEIYPKIVDIIITSYVPEYDTYIGDFGSKIEKLTASVVLDTSFEFDAKTRQYNEVNSYTLSIAANVALGIVYSGAVMSAFFNEFIKHTQYDMFPVWFPNFKEPSYNKKEFRFL